MNRGGSAPRGVVGNGLYKGMVDSILGGNSKQMRGPIPDGMWGYDASAMQYSLDLDKAKRRWTR